MDHFRKLPDPVCDKLTHAAILFCLLTRYLHIRYLLVLPAFALGMYSVFFLRLIRSGESD